MRILLVTHYYPAHGGGIEIVAGELARRLAVHHEIRWFASATDRPPPKSSGLETRPVPAFNGVERLFGLPFPIWDPRGLHSLRKACQEADVVHIHDCLYLSNLITFLYARSQGKPLLITQHIGLVPYRTALLRTMLQFLNRTVAARMLGHADQVVFVSRVVRDYFMRTAKFKASEIVPNGVDTAVFTPLPRADRQRLRERFGLRSDRPVLLFVGRFVEKKGLRLLQALATAIRDVEWVFAGWGVLDPEEWSLPHVRVLRGKRGAEVAELYQLADLLLLPSVGEGFPLVVQEAMSSGTPAIVGTETASALPGLDMLLYHEDVNTPNSPVQWERLVRCLLAQPAELEAQRIRVAAYAREHWSWEDCAATYNDILLGLAGADPVRE